MRTSNISRTLDGLTLQVQRRLDLKRPGDKRLTVAQNKEDSEYRRKVSRQIVTWGTPKVHE